MSLDLAELQELDDWATEAAAENAENAEAVRREHERLVDAVITVIESSSGHGADDIAAAQADAPGLRPDRVHGRRCSGHAVPARRQPAAQPHRHDAAAHRVRRLATDIYLAVSNDDAVKAVVVAAHRIATKKEPA